MAEGLNNMVQTLHGPPWLHHIMAEAHVGEREKTLQDRKPESNSRVRRSDNYWLPKSPGRTLPYPKDVSPMT